MRFKRMVILGFALLSAIAAWDMATLHPDELGGRVIHIVGVEGEVGSLPTRPPDYEERRTLSPVALDAGEVVHIDSMRGRLEVRPSPGREATVDYTIRVWGDGLQPQGRGPLQDAAERAASLAKEVSVRWSREEGQARLVLERPDELPAGMILLVDVRVNVPEGVGVVAQHTGDALVEGLSGSVRLETVGGRTAVRQVKGPVAVEGRAANVSLERIAGPVDVQLRGGNLAVKEVEGRLRGAVNFGELSLENVAGDVELTVGQGFSQLREIRGDLTLRGGFGETRVAGVEGHVAVTYSFGTVQVGVARSAELSMEMGEMHVFLEGEGGWTVDAVAEMGEIRTALPLEREESGRTTKVSGTVGDGAHPLKLEVSRGTAVLSRR